MNSFIDLQINPNEYYNRGINMFLVAFIKLSLLNMKGSYFIMFCVISAANSFGRIHRVKQDYTLHP